MAKKNITPQKPVTPSKPAKTAESAPNTSFSFMKQVLLTGLACLIIVILPALPRHVKMMERVKQYYKEAKEIKKYKEDEIMGSRHGENYAVPREIEKIAKPEDIFLLPPKDYILYTQKARKQALNPNNWSNPYIFYYFTDKVRTCPYDNDSLRKKATLALRFDEKVNNWGVVPIKNDSILAHIVSDYKKK